MVSKYFPTLARKTIPEENDVLMQIWPELLNGELSCYEAQVKLEPFLSPQITRQRFYNPTKTNEKKRVGRLFLDLENQNHPFAILCLFFHHHFRVKLKSGNIELCSNLVYGKNKLGGVSC